MNRPTAFYMSEFLQVNYVEYQEQKRTFETKWYDQDEEITFRTKDEQISRMLKT